MAEPRGRCRLFTTPQGCRFGNRCKFSHDRSSTPGTRTPNQIAASTLNQGRPSAQSSATTSSSAPRQVCAVFWDTGKCNRSFDCRFKHERKSNVPDNSTSQSTAAATEDPADFFSMEGMASSSGAATEDRHRLNPQEAHNHIKTFLRDNYTFGSAARVQGFVRILASINDRNKSWNSDSAQAFLDFLVKGDGLIRIGEVLRYQPVSHRIGNGNNTLSFQQGYFPLCQFMASNLVLKSTLHKNINHLYTVFKDNYEVIHGILSGCMYEMINQRSWKDPTPNLSAMLQNSLDGVVVFKTLSTVLLQFKDAIRNYPQIVGLVKDLVQWFEVWAADASSGNSRFGDGIATADPSVRRAAISQLREEVIRLQEIVQRESEQSNKVKRSAAPSGITAMQQAEADIMRFAQTYDAPGGLREGGPRHDNDFERISEIRIAPTNAELLCPYPSYLPVFRPEAPHHLRENSMERHLDIQFRLLREELVAPIRSSLGAISNDLNTIWRSSGRHKRQELTKLEAVFNKKGGAYKTSGFESLFFYMYTNAEFAPVKAERRDLSVGLLLDSPPGSGRSTDPQARATYWKYCRRLQSGSLVALAIVSSNSLDVYLGVVSSFTDDISESAKASQDRIQIQVAFFDPEIEFRALKRDRLSQGKSSYAFLVDNSIMYEASRPFLERLQTVEPTEIPFARYIAYGGSLKDVQISPPKYSTAPNFSFKLNTLAHDRKKRIDDLNLRLPNSLDTARKQLLTSSRLDPSQVNAMLDTLTREVSLIQGPPGTGKSYIGREIIRVITQSKIKPIVLIAYTNHALDHMLTAVLDEKITNRLVRLGSRSSDERIAEYTLDKLEKTSEKSSLSRSIGSQYRVLKDLEEDMTRVMESIQLPSLTVDQIYQFLGIHYPEHCDALLNPPYWITALTEQLWADEEENGEWNEVSGNKKKKKLPVANVPRTLYGFWKIGEDIAFIASGHAQAQASRKVKSQKSLKGKELPATPEVSEVASFFAKIGFTSELPPTPTSNRDVVDLCNTDAVWAMSVQERIRLAESWERNIRRLAYDSNLDRYKELREKYKDACKVYNDIRDETRRRLLSQVDLIGCTTTGAAKLTSLLESISPRVLIVEEAGQVLEAHILTSLVPSVHHLICIGDPEQLRPTLATFALSMENARGRELFKFDQSLMERLSSSGMPMSQLNVQRRMRPSISHFVRTILYPNLENNPLVLKYPAVQGTSKDVYFLNHTHPEGGSEDSVSKFNDFEVQMIRDLVLYFLRQGTYSGEGDIAVLCAYLGQVQKVRQALRDLKIAVAVDERDEEELARQGIEDNASFEQVLVAKHIRLGTVDIYQGQEAKIVIVSLVRNTGNYETASASIGFLKSSNRINVALSRAKHGMYILGNASNLRKNQTWSKILDEMELAGQIGPGIPIVCPRHPDQVQNITKPGELNRYAPEGGCLLPCGFQLPCGHICPSVCHAVLDNHRSTRCRMPCNKTPCPRSHPCSRECSADCGNCEFPMSNVPLPCGHTAKSVPCYLFDKLDDFKCNYPVTKRLARCEHSAKMACQKNPATVKCLEICGGTMGCCGRACKSRCYDCQSLSRPDVKILETTVPIERLQHGSHPCERMLYCLHKCGLDCHPKDDPCNRACRDRCRQQCSHQKCNNYCSTPCTPCMEPCTWVCAHHSCPVTCGSICARLPCDEPCKNTLSCGHPCPSICGEPCDRQKCVECLTPSQKQDIADFIMQRRLEEIDPSSLDISDRLITLDCGHMFTVETLDGHCHMSDFYEVDPMSGQFISMKAPPGDYQTPPTCPACRGPITALRYGRATKRATLDILEQNVASTMSLSLERLNPSFEKIVSSQAARLEKVKAIVTDANNVSEGAKEREEKAVGKSTEPLPYGLIDRAAMHSIHGISATEAKSWFDVAKDILFLYRDTVKIANTRGAHVKAYEGAYSTLYRLELDTIIAEGLVIGADSLPEDAAIKSARLRIGQAPPNADTKYQTEAYFRTLELRFKLAQAAEARIEAVSSAMLNTEEGLKHHKSWVGFVTFLYDSCVADSKKAREMATKSAAWRRVARCVVYQQRSDFQLFRFRVLENAKNLRTTDPNYSTIRQQLSDMVMGKIEEMSGLVDKYQTEYLKSWSAIKFDKLQAELRWFQDNCRQKIHGIAKDLEKLEEYVRKGGVYQPVTKEDMLEIIQAFGFATTGHFYICPNGHPYTIGECGGAMQTSICPECGEGVGGSSHSLLSTNRRATELEALLQQSGARRGMFG